MTLYNATIKLKQDILDAATTATQNFEVVTGIAPERITIEFETIQTGADMAKRRVIVSVSIDMGIL